MRRNEEDGPTLPPRIQAAFNFLHHTRMITDQIDAAIPTRPLTPLERSVEAAALRAVQQYLLGEMDFVETPPPAPPARRDDNDDDSSADRVTATP